MRLQGLLGNDGLKARLAAGQLSHCYILEGPAGSGRKTLARLLAAAMECEGKGKGPCGLCNPCRKVLKDEHPDVITVDSDKATVPISLIRQMQSDAYIRPNEGARKVYILPRAQDMQGPAQNALLKLLEEPPGYCAFILITDSADKLLETVRSRAVVLTLAPLSAALLTDALKQRRPEASGEAIARAADRSDGYLGRALSFLDTPDTELETKARAIALTLADHDELALMEALFPLDKLGKQPFLDLLAELERLLLRAMGTGSADETAARLRSGCSSRQLYQAAGAVKDASTLLQANGSAGHAMGMLLAELTVRK